MAEAGENGKYQSGAHRGNPKCGVGGTLTANALDPQRLPLRCATPAVPTGVRRQAIPAENSNLRFRHWENCFGRTR